MTGCGSLGLKTVCDRVDRAGADVAEHDAQRADHERGLSRAAHLRVGGGGGLAHRIRSILWSICHVGRAAAGRLASMTDDRSWLTDDYPELRDGPPWVMEEMILEERDLPAGILDGTGPETADVAAAIREAAAQGDPIVVTGCGTSEHGAMAIAELIADAFPDARVEAREALDAAVRPRKGGLCIGISHDGGTRATRLALEAARGAGASTAVITAHPATSVPAVSDHVVRHAARRPLVVPHRCVCERDRGRCGHRRKPGDGGEAGRCDRRGRRPSPDVRRGGPPHPRRPPHRDDGPRSRFRHRTRAGAQDRGGGSDPRQRPPARDRPARPPGRVRRRPDSGRPLRDRRPRREPSRPSAGPTSMLLSR